jgi:hypothetical protein
MMDTNYYKLLNQVTDAGGYIRIADRKRLYVKVNGKPVYVCAVFVCIDDNFPLKIITNRFCTYDVETLVSDEDIQKIILAIQKT